MVRSLLAAALVMVVAGTGDAEPKRKPAVTPEAKPAPKIEPAETPPADTPPLDETPLEEEDPISGIPHVVCPKLVDLGHDAHHGGIGVEDALPGAVGHLVGQGGFVEVAVALPHLPPRGLVGRQGGTDDSGHCCILPASGAGRGKAGNGPRANGTAFAPSPPGSGLG